MTSTARSGLPIVADETLRDSIAQATRRAGIDVLGIERATSPYATSCPLENVKAHLSDGSTLQLVLKHLGTAVRLEGAARTKPPQVLDVEREIFVYRQILHPLGLGAALYGASTDDTTPWLLVAQVPGVEMYQIADLDAWRAAARWIARLHQAMPAASLETLHGSAHLGRYDRAYCLQWIERSLAFFSTSAPVSRHDRAALRWLASRFERVVEYLLTLPTTLIHGEYYASNVLAVHQTMGWQVYPIDWEMAALGPSVVDLAALAAGDWNADERGAMIGAYLEATDSPGSDAEDLSRSLDYAQLYLSVQWLGWFGRRRPPDEHARDWLADAVERAERLKL